MNVSWVTLSKLVAVRNGSGRRLPAIPGGALAVLELSA
jgi:hypothetical protein